MKKFETPGSNRGAAATALSLFRQGKVEDMAAIRNLSIIHFTSVFASFCMPKSGSVKTRLPDNNRFSLVY